MSAPRVSAILPTLNGAATLPPLLAALRRTAARLPLEIVAIDSGSRDTTRDLLAAAGARVLDLGGVPFGHGSTRNRAAAAASGALLLLLSQDVEPEGDGWLDPLLVALADDRVAGAFGRQVPRGSSAPEAFLAEANYGLEPRLITAADIPRFGPGLTLFSSAFGMIRRDVWAQVPLPDVVMSEDQAWAAAVLAAGWMIRYEPAAAVFHGHRFSLTRAFRRSFDSGSSLAAIGLGAGAWAAGLGHVARELRWTAQRRGPAALPGMLLYEIVRMAGYQCGKLERRLPRGLARILGEAPRA